jgi:hypothetical protein
MAKTIKQLTDENDAELVKRLEEEFKREHAKFISNIKASKINTARYEKLRDQLEKMWKDGTYAGSRPDF